MGDAGAFHPESRTFFPKTPEPEPNTVVKRGVWMGEEGRKLRLSSPQRTLEEKLQQHELLKRSSEAPFGTWRSIVVNDEC